MPTNPLIDSSSTATTLDRCHLALEAIMGALADKNPGLYYLLLPITQAIEHEANKTMDTEK